MNHNIEYLKKYLKKEDLEKGLERLKKGEAPQYIVGDVDFYGNNLIVNKNVLIPRFETELLVENTIKLIKEYKFINPKIIDVGTGSGAIAIALYSQGYHNIKVSDISNEALVVAQKNILKNNMKIDVIYSDMLDNIDEKFDVVISNPPYIDYNDDVDEIVLKNEPKKALFAPNKGLYFYERIIKDCKKVLNNKYLIAFEIGMKQKEDIVDIISNELGNVKIICKQDLSKRDRFIFVIKE